MMMMMMTFSDTSGELTVSGRKHNSCVPQNVLWSSVYRRRVVLYLATKVSCRLCLQLTSSTLKTEAIYYSEIFLTTYKAM